MEMSYHCREDRLDRLTYIATTIGWGEVVAERRTENRRECLTDTGVVMIKALDRDFLITAYIASIDRAFAIYHDVYGKNAKLPQSLYKRICKNKKYHKNQNRG